MLGSCDRLRRDGRREKNRRTAHAQTKIARQEKENRTKKTRSAIGGEPRLVAPSVCTENLIRIDCVTESPNVNGDDRALLPLPDPVRLAAEDAALRHQLIVLQRKVRGRAQLTNGDRLFLVLLYRLVPSVLRTITIIRP